MSREQGSPNGSWSSLTPEERYARVRAAASRHAARNPHYMRDYFRKRREKAGAKPKGPQWTTPAFKIISFTSPQYKREQRKKLALANGEQYRPRMKPGSEERKEYMRKYRVGYYMLHPNVDKESAERRINLLRQATPKCLSQEHRDEIHRIYRERFWKTDHEGAVYEVDHIVPLRHPDVCGLHVPWNLRIILKPHNRTKSNRFNGTIKKARIKSRH